jgi:hypothetical protein
MSFGENSAKLASPNAVVAFPELPAQLRERDPLRLMQLEVLIDEFSERDRPRAPDRSEPLMHLLKRLQCLSTARESVYLRPRRSAPFEPIPIRPQPLAGRRLRLQFEYLTLLDHLGTSSIDNRTEESHPKPRLDHLCHAEGVTGRALFDRGIRSNQ